MSGEDARRALEDWLIDNRWPDAYDLSHAILASDWLAEQIAAAEQRGREDNDERIVAAVRQTLEDLADDWPGGEGLTRAEAQEFIREQPVALDADGA